MEDQRSTDELAKILWDYHHVGHALEKADVIFALGSHDLDVGRYAAELYLEGWAPVLAFSGGIVDGGDGLRKDWNTSEAEMFRDIAKQMGVPEEHILIENQATNTGKNFELMDTVFKEKGIDPQKIILVQKPYMERRTIDTGKKHWPQRHLISVSRPISFEEYTSGIIPKQTVIECVVGDLQRIQLYSKNGFQVPEVIPPEVCAAYEELVRRGYTRLVISDTLV